MAEAIALRGAEIERAVLGYAAAWNEDDGDALGRLLEQCFAPDGIMKSNFETIVGRAALWARISSWRRETPGCRAMLTSGIEHHHNVFRFTAIVARPNGELFSPALDVGEIDAAGRIKRIITFHLELPPPPTHWPTCLTKPAP